MIIDNQKLFERAREETNAFFDSARRANVQAEGELKDEIALVDQLWMPTEPLPEWARLLYADMPDWGREACAHRWLEGLESLTSMIVQERFWSVSAGRCGEHPGWVYAGLDRLALGVENWVAGKDGYLPEDAHIFDILGQQTQEKIEAAACFIELVRATLYSSKEEWKQLVQDWRAREGENYLIERLFFDGGLNESLESICGFLIEKRLQDCLRIISGDEKILAQTRGWCNSQMSSTWQNEPQRLLVTQGYLWGWYAHLVKMEEDELSRRVPWCAGAAVFILRQISDAKNQGRLHQWLAGSLGVKTKHWYRRMLNFASGGVQDGQLPAVLWDLPDLYHFSEG